ALKDEMLKRGISPDVVTYTTLLEKVETEEDAIKWIIEFCSTNLTPNAHTRSGLDKIVPVLYESSRLAEIFAIMLRFNPLMFFNWLSNFDDVTKTDKFISEFPKEVNASDFNKLGFANYYLHQGELVSGKKFLDSVTTYNYHYFKYSGNYWYQVKDYQKAEEKYKQAIPLSENSAHRAEMYNKLSLLIKDLALNNRIDEAVEYCRESISIQPDNSPEAKQLLTYFTIEFNSIDQISNKINELKRDFNIGKKTIKEALKEISDKKKKDLIRNYS
ncbi:MAG: hypothetical protein AABX74_01745, partial [Nanoarchaeota archaeon]